MSIVQGKKKNVNWTTILQPVSSVNVTVLFLYEGKCVVKIWIANAYSIVISTITMEYVHCFNRIQNTDLLLIMSDTLLPSEKLRITLICLLGKRSGVHNLLVPKVSPQNSNDISISLLNDGKKTFRALIMTGIQNTHQQIQRKTYHEYSQFPLLGKGIV